jgi:hypothetical protein
MERQLACRRGLLSDYLNQRAFAPLRLWSHGLGLSISAKRRSTGFGFHPARANYCAFALAARICGSKMSRT